MRDYGHDHGHRVLRITRKGGKAARVPLPPPVVRALDDYLAESGTEPADGVSAEGTVGGLVGRLEPRTSGPLFLAVGGDRRYPYTSAYEQLGRLCRAAGLPRGVSPHSLRHSYATESLRLGAALQDVQDAMGHADPRTTRRYDRSRHNLDRFPNYLLASSLTQDAGESD